MTQINTSACVVYSPKQMFDLVNDAAAYPRYLPLCTEVQIRSRTAESQTATITLSKGKVRFHFTTTNLMEEASRIDLKLVDGPFKYLKGRWHFIPLERGGCEVTFHLEFEFANPLLKMAFGAFFKGLVESMVGAFCEEAASRYGQVVSKPGTGIQPIGA
jgi:ribosome-associated toxin RatA of RatAB toxin-antitoxin module